MKNIKYTTEVVNSVERYNENIEQIAQKILSLKIDIENREDMNIRNLHDLLGKLSIVNNLKSRKTTEKLLQNIIHEYGYMLEIYISMDKLP